MPLELWLACCLWIAVGEGEVPLKYRLPTCTFTEDATDGRIGSAVGHGVETRPRSSSLLMRYGPGALHDVTERVVMSHSTLLECTGICMAMDCKVLQAALRHRPQRSTELQVDSKDSCWSQEPVQYNAALLLTLPWPG